MTIRIQDVQLPDFGIEAALPAISVAEYDQRLDAATQRMRARGLDVLLVYGDREHAANIAYLTNLDPRFEEALLLLGRDGQRLLLVGNECMGYVPPTDEGPSIPVKLYQELSLLGQPRNASPPLRSIFESFGIKKGINVGCAGWKYFDAARVEGGVNAIELPSYIVDLLRDMTGGRDRVVNATDLFMGERDGLRITNTADQIAQFEFAAIQTSTAVRGVIEHIREGVSERELATHYTSVLPLSCHAMVSTGAKASRGLSSPGNGAVRIGDVFTTAFGLWGSLTARAGFVARDESDLPAEARSFYPELTANYFEVVATWYQSVRVNASGGDVFAAVEAKRGKDLYDFALNPGHYIHLDEWVHSPFFAGSDVRLRSGMAIQLDIIPVSRGPACAVNCEDGIALADEALRGEIARRYPAMWRRITARQRFMRETLGIALDDSVLPLSNTPACFTPYLLAPQRLMTQI